MADIAAAARAAGATSAQLEELDRLANEAAAGDPIEWQPWDGGESTTTAYWYGMFFDGNYIRYLTNPSEMDADLERGYYTAWTVAAVAGSAAVVLDVAAVYGISQIGAVGLTKIPAQIALEYRLLVAGGAVGSQAQQRYFGRFDSAKYPKPPGWTPQWVWGPSSGSGSATGRWWDTQGGEWRFHFADKHHLFDHWDFNAWTNYNSPWQNVYLWN